jgi:two-component system, NarL family, nitrate/nitrite response regulator NarL
VSAVKLMIADHAPTRLGIRIALEGIIEVCAEAGDARQAIKAAESTQPDVCIVGLELAGGGMMAVQGIRAVAPNAKVIVVAADADNKELLAAIRTGAIGYLPGTTDSGALRRVVTAAAAGEAAIPRAMVIELARELQSDIDANVRLTPRESQVIDLLRDGQTTAAIADRLGISPVTVRRYISILMHRTGVDTRAALMTAPVRTSPPLGMASGSPESTG